MKENKKRVIITLLIIVSMITIFFRFKTFINKPIKKFPEVKLKDIKREKDLAVMISNENGIGYKEYEGDSWPGTGYKYKEAKCVDNNGQEVKGIITFNEGANTVTLTSNETVYCTLYFDEKKVINTLRANDPKGVLSKELLGDMYRYQGYDKKLENDSVNNPNNLPSVDNNYICFGTTDKSACINNEEQYMYRIMGTTQEGNLKLIKETIIKEENNVLFQWSDLCTISSPYNASSGDCDGEKCEWPNSMIFKRLNGLNAGTISGNTGNTNIFVDSKEYVYMNRNGDWYNLIEDHNWMYGDAFYSTDATNALQIETGKVATNRIWRNLSSVENVEESYQWTKSVPAKIGLMYVHDYYFTCDYACIDAGKSWLFFLNNKKNFYPEVASSNEWLLPRLGLYQLANQDSRVTAYLVLGYNPSIDKYYGTTFFESIWASEFVRPVFYLKNTVNLLGTGQKDDPYIIDLISKK